MSSEIYNQISFTKMRKTDVSFRNKETLADDIPAASRIWRVEVLIEGIFNIEWYIITLGIMNVSWNWASSLGSLMFCVSLSSSELTSKRHAVRRVVTCDATCGGVFSPS